MSSEANDPSRYSRNQLYIADATQQLLRETRILLAGVGLGSVIAETLLRLGCENITFADGDSVELSNLNRQNYTESDIGKNKAQASLQRLRSINSRAKLLALSEYLGAENIPKFVDEADIVINAIDFDNPAHVLLDEIAMQQDKISILPLNLGFAALAAVFRRGSPSLTSLLAQGQQNYGLAVVGLLEKKPEWLLHGIRLFIERRNELGFDPQLSIGSQLSAALVSSLIVQLTEKTPVDCFPRVHFLSARD